MLHRPLLILLVAVVACQWSENRYATREVVGRELIGTWQLTDGGLADLRDVGVKEHLRKTDWRITLRQDGSCSVRMGLNVPPTDLRGVEYRVFDSGCSWRLAKLKHQEVRLAVPSQEFRAYFFVAEEHGKLLIWQYATDPDAWKYVEFEKVAGT